MYKKIKGHPTPRKVYADYLVQQQIISDEEATALANDYRDKLDQVSVLLRNMRQSMNKIDWLPYLNHSWTSPYESKFPEERFKALAHKKISEYPEDHVLQSRVAKIYNDRQAMARSEKPFDAGNGGNNGICHFVG